MLFYLKSIYFHSDFISQHSATVWEESSTQRLPQTKTVGMHLLAAYCELEGKKKKKKANPACQ